MESIGYVSCILKGKQYVWIYVHTGLRMEMDKLNFMVWHVLCKYDLKYNWMMSFIGQITLICHIMDKTYT